MIPRRYLLIGLGAVIAVLVSLAFWGEHKQNTGTQEERNAAVHQGEANAHQTQAQASDAVAEDLKAKVDSQKQDLDRVLAERNALLRKLASQSKPGQGDAHPVPGDGSLELLQAAVAIRDEVIAKDAEAIAALQADSVVKDSFITALTVSRDEWKKTAEARERQALAQEAATKAWKQAVTSSKWRGRVEGFAAGVALGYVARGQR